MVRMTIDDDLQKKLLSSGDVVELYDNTGKLLARVLPELDDPMKGMVPLNPEILDDELSRRSENDGPTITTNELISRLKAKK